MIERLRKEREIEQKVREAEAKQLEAQVHVAVAMAQGLPGFALMGRGVPVR